MSAFVFREADSVVAREDMVDQLKSPTAPITAEIPTGTTATLTATPQVTSTPSSSDATDEKPAPGEGKPETFTLRCLSF
ncbi:unnamed protein product [Cylicocyclus nassatus]|uniref:Uncharacterized protein n=1 Tax=Cylicocyclus nassatus TaxID=53992 RepID=A0AA36GF48_CYLNA|nr:unnamed protein product [Cylicocyclus nassatus]